MTRSNLHITLSNGEKFICVLDSSSAPEQGYIVEDILLPLLSFDDSKKELSLIKKHCTMGERRANAYYRYYVNLVTKEVTMFEEIYKFRTDRFLKGKDLTERYTNYIESLNNNSKVEQWTREMQDYEDRLRQMGLPEQYITQKVSDKKMNDNGNELL